MEENSVIIQNKSRKDVTNVENSLSTFCNLCKKSFSSKANLKKHQIIHNNDKPWKCELCDKTFNQKRDHNYHMARQHTMKRPNICTVNEISYFKLMLVTINETHKVNQF